MTTAARALRRDAAENRRRLLRAAWEVFAEQGADAGVDEIARRAGVGTGTLYRRFTTKDELITAMADELFDDMLDEVTHLAREQPEGALEACLWTLGEHLAAHRGCLRLLWRAFPDTVDSRRARLWDEIGRLLQQARNAGDVRDDLTLTDVYLCVLTLRTLVDETTDRAPDIWRRHLSLMLAGFRPSDRPLEHRPADDSLVAVGVPFRP